MEEIIDFDLFIKQQQEKNQNYFAIFDPLTGNLLGVYPESTASECSNRIEIDRDLAVSILEGEINPINCKIDTSNGQLEIIETVSLNRLNYVLHRIPDIKYTEPRDNDIFIKYIRSENKLTFSLTDRMGGSENTGALKRSKKIKWDGELEMVFLITDYNDPNIVHMPVKFKINDLIDKSVIIFNLDLPSKFSIFTRKIFPCYIFQEL